MKPMRISYDRHEPVTVTDVEELDATLDAIDNDPESREWPVIATISESGQRPMLQVLLGAPGWSTLLWTDRDRALEPAGDARHDTSEPVNYGGHQTWLSEGCAISKDLARQAVRGFAATGQLPGGLRWRPRA